MDYIEKIVWGTYAAIVITGLAIFIIISCCIRSKIHTCEEEQALIKQHNKRISKMYDKPVHNNGSNDPTVKESFSLFKMLM